MSRARHIYRGGRRGSGRIMVADPTQLSGKTARGRSEITEDDYRRLHPKLVTTFRRKGASPESARELAQETLLQAHRGLAKFQGNSAFDTWVVSIAKQLWLKDCRDRGRLKRAAEQVPVDELAGDAGPPATTTGPEERAVAGELLARVRRAMRRLPEEMRRALTLHVEGHKYREIAEHMGVTKNRVSSLIHQARAKLRQELLNRPADPTP